MLAALLVLNGLVLLLLVASFLRRSPSPAGDPRLPELVAALPAQLTRIEAGTDARLSSIDTQLRATVVSLQTELASLRRDAAADALHHRETAAGSALALRDEITRILSHLGQTLTQHLADFRTHSSETLGSHRAETNASAEGLRLALKQDLESIQLRLTGFISEANRTHIESREALHTRLNDLGNASTQHLERVRSTVEERLTRLNTDNSAKLEEMRATVDEKLHATLQTRLTESFGQVSTHLGEVQKGLGEMKELATGVGDLKKVLSNVKSRGVVGEFQLGLQLEQMFSPEQYIKNARIKPNTLEAVEYALKFPNGANSVVLLPIDAKFPKEDWERLEHAYEHGTSEEIATAGRAFERSIRAEGKRICEKYIDPPTTMPHAIMFLPTEALYAEVVRRPGLQSEIQQQCRVTIAGPSTFMAILTSFQMGFHTIAIEKKGNEVWRVLSTAKKEFETFGDLMSNMEKQVGTVQNTIQKLGVRSRAIGRSLKDVSSFEAGTSTNLLSFDEVPGVAPLLAAEAINEETA